MSLTSQSQLSPDTETTATPRLFHISIHCDPTIYTAPYKKVISTHSLYAPAKKGRKSGKTTPGSYIKHKIAELLLESGAVPLKESPPQPKISRKPSTLFVTHLEPYWEAAIADLAKVGIRIYVLPVMGPIEGMPDAVDDSFNAYYLARLENYLTAAQKGADVRDLFEVTLSMALAFEPAGIVLKPEHNKAIEQIRACYGDLPAPTQESPSAALYNPSVEDDF